MKSGLMDKLTHMLPSVIGAIGGGLYMGEFNNRLSAIEGTM